jgi:hypothetical protein
MDHGTNVESNIVLIRLNIFSLYTSWTKVLIGTGCKLTVDIVLQQQRQQDIFLQPRSLPGTRHSIKCPLYGTQNT